jgi:hypothetical protein
MCFELFIQLINKVEGVRIFLMNMKLPSNFINIGMKCKVGFSAHIGSTQLVELAIPL